MSQPPARFIDYLDPDRMRTVQIREDYHLALRSVNFTRGFALGYGYANVTGMPLAVPISALKSRLLPSPLLVIVEPDDDGFIARNPDLPLYGYGDDCIEAIDALKIEIETLYTDLLEDDNLTEEWAMVRELLHKMIAPRS